MRLNAFLVGTLAFALSQVAAHPLEISSSLARAEDNLNAFAVRASTSKNDKRQDKDKDKDSKDKDKDKDKDSKDEDKDSKDKDKDSKDKDKDGKDEDKSNDKAPQCKARSKTPRSLLARSRYNCGDTIEINGKKYILGNELGSGESGTVFELNDKVKGHRAVAKEYSHAGQGREESKTLEKVGQLITDAKQEDDTVFAIMNDMKTGGREKLYDWHLYEWYVRRNDNKGPQCKSFMKAVRKAIAKEVARIADKKKVVHDDFTSYGNVLLEGSDENNIKVTLIDWGRTQKVNGRSKKDIEKMAYDRLKDKHYPLNAFKDQSNSGEGEANAFSDIQCEPSSSLYDNPWR
ncbi:hypothetical protein BDZ89DRAFT_1126894 [Hymenopellis radicata]|nr:hypothetical protein BDZ89DRAFT_1126894 [Hymenopellis radicata]